MSESKLQLLICREILKRMDENPPRIEKCFDMLTEAQVWTRPNEHTNSVGNLVLHLCGNATQYVIATLGKRPDTRDRDSEFESHGWSKTDLLKMMHKTFVDIHLVVNTLQPQDLREQYKVQGFELSGIDVLIHACEHFSYHTGQIALLTKIMVNRDLGFYAGLDLNQKH